MTPRRRGPAVLAVLATLGLVVALALGPVSRREILAGYVLALAALGLLQLTRIARGEDPWLRAPSGLEAALASRGESRQRPAELIRVERELTLGSSTAEHLHTRLAPLLRDAAAARLASRHNVDLARHPDQAHALLGDAAWELVRPDRPAPADPNAPGLPLRRIAAVLDAIESV
jgi:hypothetical protein